MHNKKRKFSCVLNVHCHSQVSCSLARFDLANRGARQPVQPHTSYARLLVFDETLAQPDFAVVNCKTLVCKHEYDVKLRRHKQRTPKINDRHMPLNEASPWKFSVYATAVAQQHSLLPLDFGDSAAPPEPALSGCNRCSCIGPRAMVFGKVVDLLPDTPWAQEFSWKGLWFSLLANNYLVWTSDEFLLPNAIKRRLLNSHCYIGRYICAPPCPTLYGGSWLLLEPVAAAVDLQNKIFSDATRNQQSQDECLSYLLRRQFCQHNLVQFSKGLSVVESFWLAAAEL